MHSSCGDSQIYEIHFYSVEFLQIIRVRYSLALFVSFQKL